MDAVVVVIELSVSEEEVPTVAGDVMLENNLSRLSVAMSESNAPEPLETTDAFPAPMLLLAWSSATLDPVACGANLLAEGGTPSGERWGTEQGAII